MSTQINVTVGDQRLLQANKTRTAANQQNLDDRLLAKQTEEKAAPLVKAQRAAEERPGSIPVRRIPRRPAAQRQTQETALLFYDSLRAKPVTESAVTVSHETLLTTGIATWTPSVLDFVYSVTKRKIEYIKNSQLTYKSLRTAPVVTAYGTLTPNPGITQTLVPTGVETLPIYTIDYSVTNQPFYWPTVYKSVQRLGKGGTTKQTFVDTFSPFFSSYYNSDLAFTTAVHSSTADYTFISYVLQYHRSNVKTYVGAVYTGPWTGYYGNYVPPVSSQFTSTGPESVTTYKVGVYITTEHKTGTTFYRTTVLKENTIYPAVYEYGPILQPVSRTYYFDSLTEQEQKDFIANMDPADPRRAIYEQTSRLDYALDTVINGCMYNHQTGGAYATGFDSEGKKVIVAKGTLERNLDYYTALLVRTKPAATAIKNSVADQVSAKLPAEFSIYSQFTNTVGTDPVYGPGDLGRMFVAYGT